MSTLFDPQAYLDLPIDEPLEKRPPLPVGDYIATVKEVKSRVWAKKDEPTRTGIAYDVSLTLEIPGNVREAMGFDQPTITLNHSIMLDLTETGSIDREKGKNRRLREYREALDMNKVGESFRISASVGKMLMVKVSHEMYQGAVSERVASLAMVG